MRKRFTDSEKWRDPWYRKLSVTAKALWQWVLDNCDNAGVIEPDWELAAFQIGEEVGGAIEEIESKLDEFEAGKFWVKKFIEFQYGSLSRECRAHKPVFASLEKHRLLDRLSDGYSIATGQDRTRTGQDKGECEGVNSEMVSIPTPEEILEQAKIAAPLKAPADWVRSIAIEFRCVWEERNWRTNGGDDMRRRWRSRLEKTIQEEWRKAPPRIKEDASGKRVARTVDTRPEKILKL